MIAALLGVLAGAGCAEDETSLFIQGVLTPNPPRCGYRADPGQTMWLRGTFDVALRREYIAALLVGNQLAPRGDKKRLRAETMRINLRGAEVRLTDSAGGSILEFSTSSAGFADVNNAQQPGYGIVLTTLIPAQVAGTFNDDLSAGTDVDRTVIARVRVFGETLGGIEITSTEYTFPIDICRGCLINYPTEALVPVSTGAGVTEQVCDSTDPPKTTACLVGQDEFIDCRECAGFSDLCRFPERF